MKHWEALNEVDTQVVRLAEMRNLLAVIINGIDSSSQEEIVSAFHYIEGSIDDISEQLSEKFQQLHEAVAADSRKT